MKRAAFVVLFALVVSPISAAGAQGAHIPTQTAMVSAADAQRGGSGSETPSDHGDRADCHHLDACQALVADSVPAALRVHLASATRVEAVEAPASADGDGVFRPPIAAV